VGVFIASLLQQQLFYGPLTGATQVSRYRKQHSPIHTYPDQPSFISFLHLQGVAWNLCFILMSHIHLTILISAH